MNKNLRLIITLLKEFELILNTGNKLTKKQSSELKKQLLTLLKRV
jgi:hypothetical protein